MTDILDKIVAHKRVDLSRAKETIPLSRLVDSIRDLTPARDFKKSITPGPMTIIAEVKKASPSRGILCPNFDPVRIAEAYNSNGAAAISVLTETEFFQGSLDYLKAIKPKVKIPLLRKDFIIDHYQVFESRSAGADAILLITAILEEKDLARLLKLARDTGLQCLVETHDEDEVKKALGCGAEIIGINNRNLKTFVTDIAVTTRLRQMIPPGISVVSESGISGRADIDLLKQCGINAILVGEALVTATDPGAKLREMRKLLG